MFSTFVIPDARSAIRNPGADAVAVAPGFRAFAAPKRLRPRRRVLRFAKPRNDDCFAGDAP
jgi:hypothetical protein